MEPTVDPSDILLWKSTLKLLHLHLELGSFQANKARAWSECNQTYAIISLIFFTAVSPRGCKSASETDIRVDNWTGTVLSTFESCSTEYILDN